MNSDNLEVPKTTESNENKDKSKDDTVSDKVNEVSSDNIPVPQTIPEASVKTVTLNFDISKLLASASNLSNIIQASAKELGNFDLTALLDEKHLDIPNLRNGIKTQLNAKILNNRRTMVLYNNVTPGKPNKVLDQMDYFVNVMEAMVELCNSYYHLIIGFDNEVVGHTRMVKGGQFGLDVTKLDFISNSSISDLERLLTATTGMQYDVQIPSVMYEWEADIVNRAHLECLDENRVRRCFDRLKSMTVMLADNPDMVVDPVRLMTGERSLSMATGAHSQLWVLPGLGPFLTKTALSFSPRIELMEIDSRSDRTNLSVSTVRSDISSSFMQLSPDASTLDEISKVIAAMLYPGQILIDIPVEGNSVVDRAGALFAKLFLSTSNLCQNVSFNTANVLDNKARKFLINELSLTEADPPGGLNLLQRGARSPWSDLSTDENNPGAGWINHGLLNVNVVPDFDHAYDAAISVPQYGNVIRNSQLNIDDGNEATPPIIYREMLTYASASPRGVQLARILALRRDAYLVFLSSLNDYIYKYTYNSFKAPEGILLDMQREDGNMTHNPLIFTVRPSVFLTMWKFMPKSINSSSSYLNISMIESKIEAELSRFKVIHDTTNDMVANEELMPALRRTHKLRIALKVAKSKLMNSLASISLAEPYNTHIPTILNIGNVRDSPYATVLSEVMLMAQGNPERVGYTRELIWKTDEMVSYTGSIEDLNYIVNSLNQNRKNDWRPSSRLSLYNVLQLANNGSIIRDVLKVNNSRGIDDLVGFSFLVPYEVQVTTEYSMDDDGVTVVKSDGMGSSPREAITFSKVVDKYTVPDLNTVVYPDAHLITHPHRNVWYIGNTVVSNATMENALEYIQILNGFSGIQVSDAIRPLIRPREVYAPQFDE